MYNFPVSVPHYAVFVILHNDALFTLTGMSLGPVLDMAMDVDPR